MDIGALSQVATSADRIYQKDVQGNRLPPEFPPEYLQDKSTPVDGSKGRKVDASV